MKWFDIADAVNDLLDRLSGAPAPRPIPVRVDPPRKPR